MAVPELRAAGIFAAQAPYVALIEDHCNVVDGWATRIVAAHEQGHAVVGGSMRNFPTVASGTGLRSSVSTAATWSRAPAGQVDDLPGMNVSYDRRALEAIDDLLREGRWESWLHARLLERGFELWCERRP